MDPLGDVVAWRCHSSKSRLGYDATGGQRRPECSHVGRGRISTAVAPTDDREVEDVASAVLQIPDGGIGRQLVRAQERGALHACWLKHSLSHKIMEADASRSLDRQGTT